MYHPGDAREGIVILPPFGHEALCSAKTLRRLAEGLAALGYPVLRLEFPGTGDSVGEEDCVGMISSRVAATREAVGWMKAAAGVPQVSLIGVRLGAAIAMKVADGLALERLLLVAPVLTGRSYVRELQQMRALYVAGDGAREQAGNEYNGFSISDVSMSELRALDLRKSSAGLWAQAAIMVSASSAPARDLADGGQSSGRDVRLIPHCALAELLADPAVADPGNDLSRAASEWFGAPNRVGVPINLPPIARLSGECFVETACRFGDDGELFGILCRPSTERSRGPALVLANTGANPRSGWGRQTAELARALAVEGHTTFRIDLAGIGESRDRTHGPTRVVYVEQTGADIFAAVEYLKSLGFERPAIAGICSGAYAVFQAARKGIDISGALMINLQKFHWREGDSLVLYKSVDSYVSKLFSGAAWRRILKGEADFRGVLSMLLRRLSSLAQARVTGMLARAGLSRSPTDQQSASRAPRQDIERLLEQGIAVSMQFTQGDGGIDEVRNHLGCAGASVKGKGAFHYAVIEGADHNFSTRASRAPLLHAVRTFLQPLMHKG